MTTQKIKAFEVGKTYTHNWAGDSDLHTTWLVTARTACTITITDGNEVRRCKINKTLTQYRNAESVQPYGSYSMAPILSADD